MSGDQDPKQQPPPMAPPPGPPPFRPPPSTTDARPPFLPPPAGPPPAGARPGGPVMFVHPQQLAGRPLFAPAPHPTGPPPPWLQHQHQPPRPQKEQPKPISSQPIQGTDWLEVTCNDGSKFWHNEKTGKGSWKEPDDVGMARKLDPHKRALLERAKAMGAVIAPEFEAMLQGDKPSGRKNEGTDAIKQQQQQEQEEEEEWDVTFDEEELIGGDDDDNDNDTKQGGVKATTTPAAAPAKPTPQQLEDNFKQLLKECGVHAFSLWDKELPKFTKDSRYKALPPADRRRVFDDYCKEAVAARPTAANKSTAALGKGKTTASTATGKTSTVMTTAAKESAYRALLREHNITADARWSTALSRLSSDERFKALLPHRREALFKDHVAAQKKVEDARKEAERRADYERRAAADRQREAELADAIANYRTLLTEAVRDPYASWRETRPRLERDPQGRANHTLLDSSLTERLFREHCEDLEDAAEDGFLDLLEEKLGTRPPPTGGLTDAAKVAAAGTARDSDIEEGEDEEAVTVAKSPWDSWSIAEEKLEVDARFHRLSSSRRREAMWKRYVEDVKWNVEHPTERPRTQRRRKRTLETGYGGGGGGGDGRRQQQGVDRAYDKAYLEADRKRIRRD